MQYRVDYAASNAEEWVTCHRLGMLHERVTVVGPELTLYDFLSFMRWDYLRRHLTDGLRHIMARAGIAEPQCPKLLESVLAEFRRIMESEGIDWGDWKFHLNYRIHLNRSSSEADFDLLFKLVPMAKETEATLRRIILEGVETDDDRNGIVERRFYDLSTLPLNILLGDTVTVYFIPPADYLEPHPTKKADPYGIIRGRSRVKVAKGQPTAVLDEETKLIIGAHKFSHTLLLNIDFYCPIGCSDCYKTRMGTREYLDPELIKEGVKPKIYRHPELGELNPPTRGQVTEQAKRAVRWMNEDPRGQQVYDVIVSGGEPLLMPNETIKGILNEFQNAKNLRIFRICTGALFLGLPFRIDDELLDMLKDFSEATGVRVTIQAHLGNHHMISPEALIAVQKIRQRGIPIYSQIPIKNGVNFFLDDLDKTMEYLVELGRRQVAVGVEPYMFIVDMHPSTNAYYVPIEPLMQVWGMLVESHDYPGLERPRTLSVLFEGGNIILSGHTLFSAKKEVDKENDRVIYRIPRVGALTCWEPQIAEVFEYDEPLIEGVNDDPKSLEKLRTRWERMTARGEQGDSY
jgi:L-lysine 2,3-aminomutase